MYFLSLGLKGLNGEQPGPVVLLCATRTDGQVSFTSRYKSIVLDMCGGARFGVVTENATYRMAQERNDFGDELVQRGFLEQTKLRQAGEGVQRFTDHKLLCVAKALYQS